MPPRSIDSGAPKYLAASSAAAQNRFMPTKLTILIVESDRDRAMQIVDGLKGADEFEISVISESSGLSRRVAELNPDVVLIDLESPSRYPRRTCLGLGAVGTTRRHVRRPFG